MDKYEKNKAKDIERINSVSTALNSKTEVSPEFNRKNYTDKTKMDKFRSDYFDGKKTVKSAYGDEIVHIKHEPAKNKYRSNAAKHQAEVDHTVAEKNVYDFVKKTELPNINDADIKAAVNRWHNYQVIDKHTNTAKGAKSNTRAAMESDKQLKYKTKMVAEDIKEQVLVKGELVSKSVTRDITNISKTSISVNLAQYFEGEKSLSEASIGIIKDTVGMEINSIAVRGGEQLVNTGVKNIEKKIAKSVGEQGLKKICNDTITKGLSVVNNNLNVIITSVQYLGSTVISYANGEITTGEMFTQLAETGTNLVIMKMGAEIGAVIGGAVGSGVPVIGTAVGMWLGDVIGGMIGYIFGNTVCKSVSELMHTEENIERCKYYTKIYNEYAGQVEKSRLEMEKYLNYIHKEQQINIRKGFEHMHDAILNNDAESIASAIDYICLQFNIDGEFKTFNEFKSKITNKGYTFKLGET